MADLDHANLNRANLHEASLNEANLRCTNLRKANIIKVDLIQADLTEANLEEASLRFSNLCEARLDGANLSQADLNSVFLSGASLDGAYLNRANLSTANLENACLAGADLTEADLSEASLSMVDLTGASLVKANLKNANLQGATLYRTDLERANLERAILKEAKVLGAYFRKANLTGACIEDWNNNEETNLQDVVCEYIFLKSKYDIKLNENKYKFRLFFLERRPVNSNFAEGDFARLFQKAIKTLDLIFRDGIDWQAFVIAFRDLQEKQRINIEGENQWLSISVRGLDKRDDGSFVIRVNVPEGIDKGTVETSLYLKYEHQLQLMETKYKAELKAKDREIAIYRQQSADFMNIVEILASRPVKITQNYQQGAIIGGIVDTAQQNSQPEFHQYNASPHDTEPFRDKSDDDR